MINSFQIKNYKINAFLTVLNTEKKGFEISIQISIKHAFRICKSDQFNESWSINDH